MSKVFVYEQKGFSIIFYRRLDEGSFQLPVIVDDQVSYLLIAEQIMYMPGGMSLGRILQVSIEQNVRVINPKIKGWYQYYCRYKTWTTRGLYYWSNQKLANWIRNHGRISFRKARKLMVRMYEGRPQLFAQWPDVKLYF